MSKGVDVDELELAGLSEAELQELSEFIDPDNEMLPASDRIPLHTRKKPTGPFDRSHLLQHLKTQAVESKIGEDYVPFVKKTPKEQPAQAAPTKTSKAAPAITTEFDDMLDMLDPSDLSELAAELGLHGLISQSQSRGDDDHPIQGRSPSSGGGGGGADITYTPLEGTDGPPRSRSKTVPSRQMSAGSNDIGRETELKVPARRQLSAPGSGSRGRSPSPFRLPGMASSASQFSDDVQETDIDEAIASLQSDDPTLTQLNLNNHTRIDATLISELLEALHGNTHLKNLSMANIRFSEDHAKALAEVLRINTTLTVLNLESNRITRKGIAAIMKALAENKQTVLSELRLTNQYFAGGAGAEADIAKSLEKITSIVRLGYNFSSPSFRTRIDRYIMRNTDLVRQKRASFTA